MRCEPTTPIHAYTQRPNITHIILNIHIFFVCMELYVCIRQFNNRKLYLEDSTDRARTVNLFVK